MEPTHAFIRRGAWLAVFWFLSHIVRSVESPVTGTIEGRVCNPANGEYLERARVTVEGPSVEAFSDTAGFYRLTNVPPGTTEYPTLSKYAGPNPQTSARRLAARLIGSLLRKMHCRSVCNTRS
jgi:hypothetical protein